MNNLLEPFYVDRQLSHFNIQTLVIESKVLKKNPLGDPTKRFSPVLVPKNVDKPLSVVLVLAGFSGNGTKYFNQRFHDPGFPETLDSLVEAGQAPHSVYVFVDAMTYWGGSQFINSAGCGRYEDYLLDELLPTLEGQLLIDSSRVAVFGGSSGGYGALHLASSHPQRFPYAVAIAPDSFFEASLLPEVRQALYAIKELGGVEGMKRKLKAGRLQKRRDFHTLMNAVGMAYCYSDKIKKSEPQWPVDMETGALKKDIWKSWLKHDPVVFLKERRSKVKKVKGIYLDVGTHDQYCLQYGTRQIFKVLKSMNAKFSYSEFDGNHFDISLRRPEALAWLKRYL